MATYEVYTYGNPEAFVGVFNAIASMMGSDTFTGAMHLATLLGAITVLVMGVFAARGGLMLPLNWILGINIITLVLFMPRSDVLVVDRLSSAPTGVVSNVPHILAVLAHSTTLLGDKMTQLTETAFQVIPDAGSTLPQTLSYQQNGVMFGARLITEARKAAFSDPKFRTDFTSYVRDCLVPDFNGDPPYKDAAAFGQATDLWAAMGDTNPARYTYVGGDVRTCPEAYNNLNGRMPDHTGIAMARVAMKLEPYVTLPDAVDKFTTAGPDAAARGMLGAAAADAGVHIRQNAIINMLNDSYLDISRQYNDPASVTMATAQAAIAAQTNASWITSGTMAESALPKFRGIAQALSYALFPFVIILGLTVPLAMFGRLVAGWIKFMASLELWPPLYAIINYFGTLAWSKSAAAAAAFGDGGGGLATTTAAAIYSTAISDQGIVGYICLSIPVLSWALVNGMQGFIQGFAAGTAVQQAVHGTAGQAAMGNWSMGGVSLDRQALGRSVEEASMFSRTTAMGTTTGSVHGGFETFRQTVGSTAVKASFGENEVVAQTQRQAQSTQLANTERDAQARSEITSLGHALALDQQYRTNQERTGGDSVGTTGTSGRSTSLVSKINDAVSSAFGKEYSSEAKSEIAARIAASVATVGKAGTPEFLPFGVGIQTKLEAELRAVGVHASSDKLKAAYEATQNAMREQGVTDITSLLKDFRNDDAYKWAKGASIAGADRFDSGYQESLQHQRASEIALTEARSHEKAAQFMKDWNSGVNTDMSNYVWQELRNRRQDQEFLRLSHTDPARAQGLVKEVMMDYVTDGRHSGINQGPSLVPGQRRGGLEWSGEGWDARGEFDARAALASGAETVRDQQVANDHLVTGLQGQHHVKPGTPVRNDVGGKVRDGQSKVAHQQDDVTKGVEGRHDRKALEYRNETSRSNTSIEHRMDAPNGARTRVVEGNKPDTFAASGRIKESGDKK